VLTATMAVSLQLLGILVSDGRAARRQQTAVREATNLMQRASALPWDKLNGQTLGDFSLSRNTADELPHAELQATVEETASDAAAARPLEAEAKRISISIRWKDDRGQPVAPVRLTAWRYQ